MVKNKKILYLTLDEIENIVCINNYVTTLYQFLYLCQDQRELKKNVIENCDYHNQKAKEITTFT